MSAGKFEVFEYDDTRNHSVNVDDSVLGKGTVAIRKIMDEKRSPMVNVCMNLTSDFNKAAVIRAHNAFLGGEVYIVGKRRFDRRGTVGTHHYSTIKHSPDLKTVIDHLHELNYTVYAVDNTPAFNPQSCYQTLFPEKSAFVYGEESRGLDQASVDLCDRTVYIPQPSPVPRSLNVSQAAAVLMSEYNRNRR